MTEEQKAKRKITNAKWYKANQDKAKANRARFKENNPDYKKEWGKKNPDYYKERHLERELGYWVVYVIRNFNGESDDYCGQTRSIYNRMVNHKSEGKLNTETHEILEKFDCRLEALGFELTMHLNGYHGKRRNSITI